MTTSRKLTPALLDLMEHEKVIEQGLATFRDVGWALMQIRDGQKYKVRGHSSFAVYCREQWEFSPAHANRLIGAAGVATALKEIAPNGAIQPTSEWQIRPLTKLHNPQQVTDAWVTAVERAEGQPSSAVIEAVVRELDEAAPAPDRQPPSHPAKFSDEFIPLFAEVLRGCVRVLDPFAGTGRIHELVAYGFDTVGVELEPEWANLHERTMVGNALHLEFETGSFDAVCTSPTYGNRMADHHNAQDPSIRYSYTHTLGRQLHPDNSGAMQWGDAYRRFHEQAWAEVARVLRPGGRFVLNISDHVRDFKRQPVTAWHIDAMYWLNAFALVDIIPVLTRRNRHGENSEARGLVEYVLVFNKESE